MLSLDVEFGRIGLYSLQDCIRKLGNPILRGILWNQRSTGLRLREPSWKRFWRQGYSVEPTILFDFWVSFVKGTLTEPSTKSRNTASLCKYWAARKILIRRWIPLFG